MDHKKWIKYNKFWNYLETGVKNGELNHANKARLTCLLEDINDRTMDKNLRKKLVYTTNVYWFLSGIEHDWNSL